jgi:serine/threonine protein kinase
LPSHSLPLDTGSQAVKITLRRKRRGKRAITSRELFVCKYYRTSGIKETKIEGPKFMHREWTILSSVHHPNIVAYEDFSYDPNGAGLAKLYLEYCPGGDLSRHLRKGSQDDRLEYHEGLQVLEQLTQALLYIHHGISRNGNSTELASTVSPGLQPAGEDDPTKWTTILHRDIKPANGKSPSTLCISRLTILIVFIAEHNTTGIEVKLGDFGVARFETDGTDTYVGSKNFMAPVRPGSTIKRPLRADICFRSNELQTMTADGPPPKVTYMP